MRTIQKLNSVVVVVMFWTATQVFGAAPSFQSLGDLAGGAFHSQANAVSSDGSVVVGRGGSGGQEAFRWTAVGGIVGLGYLDNWNINGSEAFDVSPEGSVVVGVSFSGPGIKAFRWAADTGMIGLGDLAGGSFESEAKGVSADGGVIVGYSSSGLLPMDEAFRWTAEDGMVGLGALPGDSYSIARGISADGSTIIGMSSSRAFCWTTQGGMVDLGDLPGGDSYARADNISADGSFVVGQSSSEASGTGHNEAFRWTESGDMVALGDLPGGSFHGAARGVSDDGSVVVGWGTTDFGAEAFIWDQANGMRNLRDVLVNDFSLNLTGWTLREAYGISDDGLTIVGHGTHSNGDTEAWIATIPEPTTLAFLVLGGLTVMRRRR